MFAPHIPEFGKTFLPAATLISGIPTPIPTFLSIRPTGRPDLVHGTSVRDRPHTRVNPWSRSAQAQRSMFSPGCADHSARGLAPPGYPRGAVTFGFADGPPAPPLIILFFFLIIRPPPVFPLFPHATLSR